MERWIEGSSFFLFFRGGREGSFLSSGYVRMALEAAAQSYEEERGSHLLVYVFKRHSGAPCSFRVLVRSTTNGGTEFDVFFSGGEKERPRSLSL